MITDLAEENGPALPTSDSSGQCMLSPSARPAIGSFWLLAFWILSGLWQHRGIAVTIVHAACDGYVPPWFSMVSLPSAVSACIVFLARWFLWFVFIRATCEKVFSTVAVLSGKTRAGKELCKERQPAGCLTLGTDFPFHEAWSRWHYVVLNWLQCHQWRSG